MPLRVKLLATLHRTKSESNRFGVRFSKNNISFAFHNDSLVNDRSLEKKMKDAFTVSLHSLSSTN